MKIYAKIVGYGMSWFILFVLAMNATFGGSNQSAATTIVGAILLLGPVTVYGYLTFMKIKELYAQFRSTQP